MKNQALIFSKNKSKKLKGCLLQFLFHALRVKPCYYNIRHRRFTLFQRFVPSKFSGIPRNSWKHLNVFSQILQKVTFLRQFGYFPGDEEALTTWESTLQGTELDP